MGCYAAVFVYNGVQVQAGKRVLEHADLTIPARQHELDHTDLLL